MTQVADWVKKKKAEAREAAQVQAELRGNLIPAPGKKKAAQGKLEVGPRNAEQEKIVHRSVADFFFSQKSPLKIKLLSLTRLKSGRKFRYKLRYSNMNFARSHSDRNSNQNKQAYKI